MDKEIGAIYDVDPAERFKGSHRRLWKAITYKMGAEVSAPSKFYIV